MKTLPLYPSGHFPLAVDTAFPLPVDTTCVLCPRATECQTVCLPPTGDVGEDTVLVVGAAPTHTCDVAGLGFVDEIGRLIRNLIATQHDHAVYTYAIRCASGGGTTSAHVTACRGFLAHIIDSVAPSRILCYGRRAYEAVTGRSVEAMGAVGGYDYTLAGTLVLLLPEMSYAAMNTFERVTLIEETKKALVRTDPPRAPVDAVYYEIESAEDSRIAAERLGSLPSLTFDTEYSGGPYTEFFRIDTIGIVPTGGSRPYVWHGSSLEDQEIAAPLRDLLETEELEFVGHNVKVDLIAVRQDPRLRATVNGSIGDTMIWAQLVNSDALAGLSTLGERVGMGGHKNSIASRLNIAVHTIKQTRLDRQEGFSELPGFLPRPLEAALAYPALPPLSCAYGLVDADTRALYCALDVVVTSHLVDPMTTLVQEDEGSWNEWNNLLKGMTKTLVDMEIDGVGASSAHITVLGKFVDKQIVEIKTKLAAHGVTFDLTKRALLAEFLYDTLGLPMLEKTAKGGRSTAAGTLEKLADKHPAVSLILECVELQTIASRYSWGYNDYVFGGRIHSSFSLMGTKTGRLTSKDPNLLNQPSHGTFAKKIKGVFSPKRGSELVQLDFSQIEYRVGALMSQDQAMIQTFKDGIDLHRRTAEIIGPAAWGISTEKMKAMTPSEMKSYRSSAKTVNFGCVSLDTQILVQGRGWLYYHEVNVGEYTRGNTGWVRITEKVRYDSAPTIAWNGFQVTPNHRFVHGGKGQCSPLNEIPWKSLIKRQPDADPMPKWSTAAYDHGQIAFLLGRLMSLELFTPGDQGVTLKRSVLGEAQFSKLTQLVQSLRVPALPCGGQDLPIQHISIPGDVMSRVQQMWSQIHENPAGYASVMPVFCAAQLSASVLEGPPLVQTTKLWSALLTAVQVAAYRSGMGMTTIHSNEDEHWITKETPFLYHAPFVSDVVQQPVWCVRTTDETWTMKRQGAISLTGNTLYGLSVNTLAKDLGISVDKATGIYESINGVYVQLNKFLKDQVNFVREHGYCRMMWDGQPSRRRRLVGFGSSDGGIQAGCRNQSLNSPLQGTAALICLRSMVAINEFFKAEGLDARIVLSVYDSIIIEAAKEISHEATEVCLDIMQSWPFGDIPLVVDVERGTTWGTMKDVKKDSCGNLVWE